MDTQDSKNLPDRLSLVLYPVIFASRPQKEANRIADELLVSVAGKRSTFMPLTHEELRQMVTAIRGELERPTRNVRDILDLQADEKDVREYLALLADRLDTKLNESRPVNGLDAPRAGRTTKEETPSGWSLPLSWIFVVLVVLVVVILVVSILK